MATEVGNLSTIAKVTESLYEEGLKTQRVGQEDYDSTAIYFIEDKLDKVLWTNPNPWNEMTPQFISIEDCSDYRYIVVSARYSNSNSNGAGIGHLKFINPFYKGEDTNLINRKTLFTSWSSNWGDSFQRHLKMMGPTNVYVMNGYTSTPSGSPQYTQANYAMVPYQIIGTNRL